MADRNSLTAARLHEALHYQPSTGIFTWLVGRIGRQAGYIDGERGYRVIRLDGRNFYAHRLAFFYMTGLMPREDIDHKDGNKDSNKWSNLRAVSRTVNLQNQRIASRRNCSGLLGAYKKRNKWESKIVLPDGRIVRLGIFETAVDAHEAYVKAKRIHHEGCTI